MEPIYKIAEQHKELQTMIEREEVTAEDVADTFEALEGELSVKAESLIAVVNNMDLRIDEISAAITRLTALKKAETNKKEQLRDYLKYNMQNAGITNIKCPLFSVTLAKGRDVVFIDDESAIPDEYVSVEVVEKPNKARLLKDLKTGVDIPGARLEKTEESLRIK